MSIGGPQTLSCCWGCEEVAILCHCLSVISCLYCALNICICGYLWTLCVTTDMADRACVCPGDVCERDMGGMLQGPLEACEGTASPSSLNPDWL